MTRPLALTLGEPAGIGPDITLAAWERRAELGLPPFYLLADPDFVAERARVIGLQVPLRVTEAKDATAAFASALPVVPLAEKVTATPGKPDSSSGPAAIASIRRAVADVFAGHAHAVWQNRARRVVSYRPGFAGPGHPNSLGNLRRNTPAVPH